MKSENMLRSFTEYCRANPDARFWQALRGWSGYAYLMASAESPVFGNQLDTYYWQGRRGDEKTT